MQGSMMQNQNWESLTNMTFSLESLAHMFQDLVKVEKEGASNFIKKIDAAIGVLVPMIPNDSETVKKQVLSEVTQKGRVIITEINSPAVQTTLSQDFAPGQAGVTLSFFEVMEAVNSIPSAIEYEIEYQGQTVPGTAYFLTLCYKIQKLLVEGGRKETLLEQLLQVGSAYLTLHSDNISKRDSDIRSSISNTQELIFKAWRSIYTPNIGDSRQQKGKPEETQSDDDEDEEEVNENNLA